MSDTPTVNHEVANFGDHSFTISALHPRIVHYAVTRMVAHKLGNEVAAKISGLKDKAVEAGTPMTDESIAQATATAQAEMADSIRNGTMGTRSGGVRGPRATPLEATIRAVALERVKTMLAAAGMSLPTGDKVAVFPGPMVDGAPTTISLTREDLIARQIAMPDAAQVKRWKSTVTDEAAKRVRDAERTAARARDAEGDLADALGL